MTRRRTLLARTWRPAALALAGLYLASWAVTAIHGVPTVVAALATDRTADHTADPARAWSPCPFVVTVACDEPSLGNASCSASYVWPFVTAHDEEHERRAPFIYTLF